MDKCIYINEEKCTACGECISECPKSLLRPDAAKTNSNNVHPVSITSWQRCSGCMRCMNICTNGVFTVHKIRKRKY